jgi:hypothetical protein
MKNLIDVGPPCCEATGLVQSDNTVFCAASPPVPPPPPLPPGPPIANYSQFSGIDITLDPDAYGGLCTNEALHKTKSVWETPTALCDLLNCPRFGTFGGNGRPLPGPPLKGLGYCIKGWGETSTPTHSYLSQTRCGGGVAAKTVFGGCNRPTARYTLCPNGAGTTQVIGTLPGSITTEQASVACERDARCVGFTLDSGGANLLSYGLKGVGLYTGYASYTRIPSGQ